MGDPYTSGRYALDNPDWHESDAPHKAKALADLIRYAGLHPRTVADVGCGAGGVLRHLAKELADDLPHTAWEGWDIAKEAIRRARQHEGGNVHFVRGDFLASERRVDLILCIDVIEHVVDDLTFLSDLRERAQWFVFRIPLDLSALDVVRPARLLQAVQRYGHRHLYTRELALQRLTEAGYDVQQVTYDRVPPPADTVRQRWVDRARSALFARQSDLAVRLVGGYSLLALCRQ